MRSASDIALEKAQLDSPDFNISCRVLAEESNRFLVVASLYKKVGPTVRPHPVILYAVQKTTESAERVDSSEGLAYGFNTRLRR